MSSLASKWSCCPEAGWGVVARAPPMAPRVRLGQGLGTLLSWRPGDGHRISKLSY